MSDQCDWGPTGVGALKESLSDTDRNRVRELLGNLAPPSETDRFIAHLDDSIALYHALKAIADESVPRRVRDQLVEVKDAASAFMKAMDRLTVAGRYLVNNSPANKSGPVDLFGAAHEPAAEIHQALESAAQKAGSHVRKGTHVDHAKLQMAAHAAYGMRQCLGVLPTSKKDGYFEELVEILVEAATGREPKNVRKLVRRALRVPVNMDASGMVELGSERSN